MTLEEILWLVNDNTVVNIYDSETNNLIATYDGKNSIPEELNGCEIATDIFVNDNCLCIEIDTEVVE